MRKKAIMYFMAASLLVGTGLCSGGTWRLDDEEQWENVKSGHNSEYLLTVADIKQLVSTGQVEKARKGFAELKANFPHLAGADFDEFTRAELLFAQRKFAKAAKRYDRFMDKYADSPLYESVLQRQFMIAQGYLLGQKRSFLKVLKLSAYDEGTTMMDKIVDRTGDAPIAKKAIKTVAISSEEREAFAEAFDAWADMSARWPSGQTDRDSMLGMARNMHNAYRGPLYDAKVAEEARSYYTTFQTKYPGQAKQLNVKDTLLLVDEQLADKRLTVGKYYEKTSKKAAAKFYYEKVIANWPGSVAATEARNRLNNMAAEPVLSAPAEKKSWLRRAID